MSGLQGRKVRNVESPVPGCLGRMVNLFDLGTAVRGSKLLTDKPHLDGPSLSRSRSNVVRMPRHPFGEHVDDKVVVSELRRSASSKVNGTPMKKLLAQEMSKEAESNQNPTNIVAKLMGLDACPQRQFDTAAQRSKSEDYSQCSSCHEAHIGQDCNEYKDVYEIWQSPKTNHSRDSSPRKGRYGGNIDEKRMALVRQKFMEAKRLVTDVKFHQSKEFQDALEVLSSNKDVFVKFLQESNSFFSQHLSDFQSVPTHPETKRITVLRPTKMAGIENFVLQQKRSNKQIKKSASLSEGTDWDKSNLEHSSSFVERGGEQRPTQPTRIVVLKPNPEKAPNIKAVASSSPSSPRILHDGDYFEEPEGVESREARERAKEITQEMRENLIGHRRDETPLSFVFSNVYPGDDSSLNKSEVECVEGNLSDSEIMSPTSRHSWDCVNRFGSSYSSPSFSQASFSPESSVCKEAKKRLSERWALVASNGSFQQQKHDPKSSSTLGEMLALSDIKKPVRSEEESHDGCKLESRASTSCLSSVLKQEESPSDSPKSLLRSKSVPTSSTATGARLNVAIPVTQATKAQVPRELTESKSMKSSWKVPSFFFFRNRKASKEKTSVSLFNSESQLATPETPASPTITGDNAFPCTGTGVLEEGSSSPTRTLQQQSIFPTEEEISMAKKLMPGSPSENQDQPSPISVLQPPFEEDDNPAPDSSGLIKLGLRGAEISRQPKLVDKSPRIGSISRTLSWDDSVTDTSTTDSAKPASTGIEEEQDLYLFIHTLLSAASLDGNVQADSLLAKWHLPDSPLDPSLRDRCTNPKYKELIHEAKLKHRRSKRKLVFDYVNAALAEIKCYGLDKSIRAPSFNRSRNNRIINRNELLLPTLADYLWAELKDWFSHEVNCAAASDTGDTNGLVAERAVKDEIVGRVWGENMRIEGDNVGREIEGKLMEELVEEAVIDFASRV